jgi:hypothetical protein
VKIGFVAGIVQQLICGRKPGVGECVGEAEPVEDAVGADDDGGSQELG